MKKGFTLIEILVVIFIMGIMATVVSDVLLSVFRSSNKTNILNEVNQNADFILNSLESTIRNGKNAFMNGNNLVIIDQYNQRNEFTITTDSINYSGNNYSVGVIKKALAGGTFFAITNNNPATGVSVVIANTSFTVSTSNPPLICVTLRLIQGPASTGRIDYQADRTFPKCFELRKY